MPQTVKVKVNDKWYTVEVQDLTTNPIHALVDGEFVEVDLEGLVPATTPITQVEEIVTSEEPVDDETPSASSHTVRAPMPGVIMSMSVNVGDTVQSGDEICILEAMKMQQSIRTDAPGKVLRVLVERGQQILGGATIAELG